VTLEEVPDRAPQYTPEEEQTLTGHLLALTERVDRGDFSKELITPRLLCALHGALFQGVRDHAGKIRKRGFGSERLTFGPHRSDSRDEVPEKLDKTLEEARTMVTSLLARPEDPTYEKSALHIAVWVHAKVIRIHPFEDGNGRTSRLLMGIILVFVVEESRRWPVFGAKRTGPVRLRPVRSTTPPTRNPRTTPRSSPPPPSS